MENLNISIAVFFAVFVCMYEVYSMMLCAGIHKNAKTAFSAYLDKSLVFFNFMKYQNKMHVAIMAMGYLFADILASKYTTMGLTGSLLICAVSVSLAKHVLPRCIVYSVKATEYVKQLIK